MVEKEKIKRESELKRWFNENYKKMGYDKIIRKDIGICPDIIALRGDKEIKIELETVASNFLLHKHSLEDVDEIVCVIKDMELGKPIIVVDELEFIGNSNKKVTLSVDDEIYDEFQEYCKENAIMLSKRVEIFMKKVLEDAKK